MSVEKFALVGAFARVNMRVGGLFVLFMSLLMLGSCVGSKSRSSGSAMQGNGYSAAVRSSINTVLDSVDAQDKLEGRRIAVYGFCEAGTNKYCTTLSASLEAKSSAAVSAYNGANRVDFTVVTRSNYRPLEDEHIVNINGSRVDYDNLYNLLEPSDVLITGTWADEGDTFELTIRAVEVRKHGTRELATVQETVSKNGLAYSLLECLDGGGKTVQQLQKELNKQEQLIEEARKKRETAEKKALLKAEIEKRRQILGQLRSRRDQKGKSLAYTSRVYDKNFAFVDIKTSPPGLDVYVDGNWIGNSPIQLYEIEAGRQHTITAKGDPRYFKSESITRSYVKRSRKVENLSVDRGTGKIMLLSKAGIIDRVWVDGREVSFDKEMPVIEVPVGERSFVASIGGFKGAELKQDIWIGDELRRDITGFDIPKAGDTYTDPTTGMEFVWVPGGCYQMGSNDGAANEKPVHDVCVDGFWMGKYEVTNAQYRKYKSGHDSKDYEGNSLNGNSQPAVYVSWDDATAYAKWLSSKGNGKYRLPTEAEWEYAARAGTTGKRYWGDSDSNVCAYANVNDQTSKRVNKFDWESFACDDGYAVTSPVGRFKPNKFGLHDMMGNVWEWCEDWYNDKAYSKHSRKNPIYTSGGDRRVLRGGGWRYIPSVVRSAIRYGCSPDRRIYGIGFRLVRESAD